MLSPDSDARLKLRPRTKVCGAHRMFDMKDRSVVFKFNARMEKPT